MISTSEVRAVLKNNEIIEDYPEDSRGHSCLLLGYGNEKRPIHVVCSPKDGILAIITADLPDPNGLLDGTGKKLRHAKIRSMEDVENPIIHRLIDAALA